MSELCFSKSPIREVVFEITHKKDIKWDPTIPGLFFEEIKEKFPHKSTVHEGMVEFQFNAKAKEPIQNFSQNEIPQFLTPEKNIFILVKKNSLSFHHLKNYTSWENFSQLIEYGYKKYVDVIKRAMELEIDNRDILQLNLRYVNKIEIPKDNFKVEEYFAFHPTLIDDERNIEAFIAGALFVENKNSLKTQINTAKSDNDALNFILNIECYTTTIDEEVIKWINTAHNMIEKKFLKSLKPKTIKLFE